MTEKEMLQVILDVMQDMRVEMQGMNARIDRLETEMQGMNARIDRLETEMQGTKAEMQSMKAEMQGMKAEMKNMNTRIDNLETGLQENNNRLSVVEQKVNQMQYMLENEIRKGIQIIGEGHANLDRKLNAAIEVKAEREQLELRVLSLEIDMKSVKKQVLHGA